MSWANCCCRDCGLREKNRFWRKSILKPHQRKLVVDWTSWNKPEYAGGWKRETQLTHGPAVVAWRHRRTAWADDPSVSTAHCLPLPVHEVACMSYPHRVGKKCPSPNVLFNLLIYIIIAHSGFVVHLYNPHVTFTELLTISEIRFIIKGVI